MVRIWPCMALLLWGPKSVRTASDDEPMEIAGQSRLAAPVRKAAVMRTAATTATGVGGDDDGARNAVTAAVTYGGGDSKYYGTVSTDLLYRSREGHEGGYSSSEIEKIRLQAGLKHDGGQLPGTPTGLTLFDWSITEPVLTHRRPATTFTDWRTVPVRIITLKGGSPAVALFQDVGFVDVVERSDLTVDLSHASPTQCELDGLITPLARLSLEEGPRRAYELVSVGAIGIYLSHLSVCSENHTTLVLEEDARPNKVTLETQFPRALELTKTGAADVIIFGPVELFSGMSPWLAVPGAAAPDFEELGSRGFFGMQGVLYTPEGCQQMRRRLGPPIEMQIDGAISFYTHNHALFNRSANSSLNVWVEVGAESVVQEHSIWEVFQPHINGLESCLVYSNWTGCWVWSHYLVADLVFITMAYLIYWQGWLWGRRSVRDTGDGKEASPCCYIFLCKCPPVPCAGSRAENGLSEATGLIGERNTEQRNVSKGH